MSVWKITFGFVDDVFGASETYYSRDLTPDGLGPAVQQLIDVRNAILPISAEWVGVRFGLADGSRQSGFLPPGTWTMARGGIDLVIPPKGEFNDNTDPNQTDQARSTLQLRLVYDDGRSTTRYLAFIPDILIGGAAGTVDLGLNPAWSAAFDTYANELTSAPWFIRALSRGGEFAPKPIVGWVQAAAAPLNLGVEILSADFLGITKTDFVRISGVRRRGTDKVSYNGRYKVSDINTTLIPDSVVVFLASTETGDPNSVKLPGKIAKEGFGFEEINSIFVLRGGVHKRGRPFGVPRGRRLSRVKLDP